MKKKKIDLLALRQLHRAGELDQAKEGYLAILRVNPRNVEVLHALGILSTQQENFSEAMDYLQKAIRHQPQDPTLQLHLANVLKLQGLFSQAIQLLETIVGAHCEYVPALNNLGTVYYAQGKLDEAITYYEQAIQKQPNYMDAYYNLGLALAKKNLFSEAIHIYQKILVTTPDHFAARFHLACVYMQQKNIPAAITEFLAIEVAQPYHFETHTNLATCYLQQGELNAAKSHYIKALELRPKDTQILFNLGVICMQQGYVDSAIQYYQRTLMINPDFYAAQNNIGVAFLAKQHVGYALQHFQEALRIQPGNTAVAYTINMLAQNQRLLAAPPDYVQALFDGYADHYESHLLNALDYKIPALLLRALAGFIPHSPSVDILDLGCGTGLCGIPLKACAKTLVGVDISPKMLEIAQQKAIYDELVAAELITFIRDKSEKYDLILAGDVLVYIGDLETTLNGVNLALRSKGFFAFNTEICEAPDYKMNQSGRFSHSKSYIDALATTFHFKIVYYQMCVTRMQNNEPVKGHLYIFQKA